MVTVGFYPDGRPGEVFTHGARSGSISTRLLADACVDVSCLMQHGVEPQDSCSQYGGGSGTLSPPRSLARSSISPQPQVPSFVETPGRQAHDRRTDAQTR
jgi:hypothetical protein